VHEVFGNQGSRAIEAAEPIWQLSAIIEWAVKPGATSARWYSLPEKGAE
jgi:hypothetical protein